MGARISGLSQAQSLKLDGALTGAPSWSPSGTLLAIPIFRDNRFLTIITDGVAELAAIDVQSRAPKWSPNEKLVALDETSYVDIVSIENGKSMLRLFGSFSGDVRIAWSPRGNRFVMSSGLTPYDGDHCTVRVIDAKDPETVLSEQPATAGCDPVCLPNGTGFVVPTGIVKRFGDSDHEVTSALSFFSWEGNLLVSSNFTGKIRSLACHPEKPWVAVASGATLTIIDSSTGANLRELEGHLDQIIMTAFSPSGKFLATDSYDGTTRVWDCLTWTTVVAFDMDGHAIQEESFKPQKLPRNTYISLRDPVGFHRARNENADPGDIQNSTLAWHSKNDDLFLPGLSAMPSKEEPLVSFLRVWRLDHGRLVRPTNRQDRVSYYSTAKVALLGDTGVGKSGLGLVMSGHRFTATDSTHGRTIWSLGIETAEEPGLTTERREILLWDFAGQPGYRLVHQLQLRDVVIALILFDSRNEVNPVAGVKHWSRALRQVAHTAGSFALLQKIYLVAARVDRGGPTVSLSRIHDSLPELDIQEIYWTSAKTGRGIEQLKKHIIEGIDWEMLPRVSSDALFEAVKAYLMHEKEMGSLLPTMRDLVRGFVDMHPMWADFKLYTSAPSDKDRSVRTKATDTVEGDVTPSEDIDRVRAAFEICVGRIAAHGLVRRLRFGDILLLRPEYLDAYASAIVNRAKFEPDGLGVISEDDILAGDLELADDDRLDNTDDERVLLIATIDELLNHDIALRENTEDGPQLVFPSELTAEQRQGDSNNRSDVTIRFEGPTTSIYATLVVRLSRTGRFSRTALSRCKAEFMSDFGGTCGLRMDILDEGKGVVTIYYNSQTTEETRRSFESYVISHLTRKAISGSISVNYVYRCPNCDEVFPDRQIAKRSILGFRHIKCPICEEGVVKLDRVQPTPLAIANNVRELENASNMTLSLQSARVNVIGKETVGQFDVFLCYNQDDREFVRSLHSRLLVRGIRPWLDEREICPGTSWQTALEEIIPRVGAAAVIVGQNGVRPWQHREMNGLLREFIERRCRVIPVLTPQANRVPRLPLFLREFSWVDFRIADPDPLDVLIWGITGHR